MFWDSFLCEKQSDELVDYEDWYEERSILSEGEYVSPDEYDDWMAYVYATVHN